MAQITPTGSDGSSTALGGVTAGGGVVVVVLGRVLYGRQQGCSLDWKEHPHPPRSSASNSEVLEGKEVYWGGGGGGGGGGRGLAGLK